MLQLAVAALLSGVLLVETAALFDEDLGTPVPLFHEWTCYGTLDVGATDGYGNPSLRIPNSGLNASASWEGELVKAYFRAFVRHGEGPWEELPPARDDRGWHIFFIERVEPSTQAYTLARDISGKRCSGESVVIPAEAAQQPPTPSPSGPP